jgi:hypothetical protein
MAKVTNMRERVHQPFRDALCRTAGMSGGSVEDITDLFTRAGKSEGESNLKQGSVLPSDQSMVILVLRVLLHFYAPVARSAEKLTTSLGQNGDYFIIAGHETAAVNLMNGSVPGDYHDVHRLYTQASEQLLWDFGAGEKFSIRSMPSSYFPWGGGLAGDIGGATDLVYWSNGTPDHAGVLRLGRAITLPPRQNVTCQAKIVRMPDGGNAATFGATQEARVMYDLKSNLNAVDLVHKTIAFCFDGLFSRDVQ